LTQEVAAIRAKLADLVGESDTKPLTASGRRSFDSQIRGLIAELEAALSRLDPTTAPTSVFDPSNPKVVGRFTALALVAQPRHALGSLGRFYGSGVYALYYNGDHPLYRPLSGTETPIYVGKAGPAAAGARTPREQGERLATRLADHRKNIT
jgi:hypothetical protein